MTANRRKPRIRVSRIIMYIVLIMLALFYLIPLFWMLRSSLMRSTEIVSMRPFIFWPKQVQWDNYSKALTYVPFLQYFGNTMLIMLGVMAGTLLSSSLAAFSFSRIRWRGRSVWFGILMSGMMLPGAVTLISTYLGWGRLGLVNTLWPLIIPAFFGGGMFNIFLLRQFFNSIPMSLDEAAFVDGAGYLQIYGHVILPLSKAPVVVVALFTFLAVWNDYFGPIIYLNDQDKFTLAIGLLQFRSEYSTKWNLVMAASTVVVIPCLVVFLVGQKQLIEGITLTGLKG